MVPFSQRKNRAAGGQLVGALLSFLHTHGNKGHGDYEASISIHRVNGYLDDIECARSHEARCMRGLPGDRRTDLHPESLTFPSQAHEIRRLHEITHSGNIAASAGFLFTVPDLV